ncbi:hypothetical protein RclHR1_16100001, partial [Rhizophagus clarus]
KKIDYERSVFNKISEPVKSEKVTIIGNHNEKRNEDSLTYQYYLFYLWPIKVKEVKVNKEFKNR